MFSVRCSRSPPEHRTSNTEHRTSNECFRHACLQADQTERARLSPSSLNCGVKLLPYRLVLLYRLENWERRLAPLCPYFFRSFILESRVRNPALRSGASIAGSYFISARPNPMMIAPACPVGPPPAQLAQISSFPPVLLTSRGPKIALRSR